MAFDTTVHHFDPKTGKVIKETPYRLVIDRDRGNFYIRDNKRYHMDGSPMDMPPAPEVAAAVTVHQDPPLPAFKPPTMPGGASAKKAS